MSGDGIGAAGDAAARLELRAVGRSFGAVRALDGVSLAIRAGEIIALLGDSGCGKSTLLRVIAGLEHPDSGQVLLDGQVVSGSGASLPPESRSVGLMFQDYALFPHLTIAENVRFGLNRLPKARAAAIAGARLEQVGLAARADGYPGTLSGGEGQRVALARALAPEPRILLLDEPFSNLDGRTRDRVRADTLALLRGTGTTTILVTHDPEEALAFSDRIVLMRGGRIVQTGTAEDLYLRPVSPFAARFFSETVEIPGRCRGARVATPLGDLPAPGFTEGEAVRVHLRPEAVRLRPSGDGVPARVRRRSFLGATARLQVEAEGFDGFLTIPVQQVERAEEGDVVGLAMAAHGAFVFAADAE